MFKGKPFPRIPRPYDSGCIQERKSKVVAAHQGHLDAVRFLVEQGADIEKANDYGMDAMRSATGCC